jgi:arylsulfatase A-like enzyme
VVDGRARDVVVAAQRRRRVGLPAVLYLPAVHARIRRSWDPRARHPKLHEAALEARRLEARRSRRPRGPGVWLAVAVVAATSTCQPSSSREAVLGRLGGLPPLEQTRPPQTATPLQIDLLTRNALPAVAGGIEASVPEGATRLLLSTSLHPPKAAVGPARFVAEVRDAEGGAWKRVFEERRTPEQRGWQDAGVPLEPGAKSLRLSVEGDGRRAGRWGSVAFLGPERPLRGRPNLVIVVLDTLGASYLSSFGGPPGTSPHIDTFLEQAFSFRRAFSQHSNTLASHMSLFSAEYPIRHGVLPVAQAVLRRSLVERLAEAGYRTAAFTDGGFVSAGFGFSHGFDVYHDGFAEAADTFAGAESNSFALAREWLASGPEQFFLFLHTYAVHTPYIPRTAEGRAFANRLTPGDRRVWSEPRQALRILSNNHGVNPIGPADLRRLRALYLAEIHEVDALLGDFLAFLEQRGLGDDTILVLTSDHGEEFEKNGIVGHSGSLRNRVLHVPLALRGPGIVTGSTEAPVELVDLMPTLLELVGLPLQEQRDGQSLVGLLRGDDPAPGPAFSETRWVPGECKRAGAAEDCVIERFAVQTGRFKFERSAVPAYTRLFDLAADPREKRDVSAQHPAEAERHAALLERYRTTEGAAGSGERELRPSPETLERLRRLGYVDEVEASEGRWRGESSGEPEAVP